METPVILIAAYDFAKWMYPKITALPRSYGLLGQRQAGAVFGLLEELETAAWRKDRDAPLRRANEHLNHLRLYLRFAKDMKVLPAAAYHHGAERLDEIGRMLGGWAKSSRVRQEER